MVTGAESVTRVEDAIHALGIGGLSAYDAERVARVACAPLLAEIERLHSLLDEALDLWAEDQSLMMVEPEEAHIFRIRREAGLS